MFSSLKEILWCIQWWELHCRCQQRAHGPLYKICSGICCFRELLLAPLSSQREQSCTDLVMLVVTNLCYSCNPQEGLSFCITSAGLVVHFFKRCEAVFSFTSVQHAAHTLNCVKVPCCYQQLSPSLCAGLHNPALENFTCPCFAKINKRKPSVAHSLQAFHLLPSASVGMEEEKLLVAEYSLNYTS